MHVNDILKKFQNGKKEESYHELNIYIKSNPKDLVAIYNFAYMSEILNKTEIAIKNYLLINKKDKKNWKSRFNLYLIFLKRKKFNNSLLLINEVLNIKPNYQPALRDRALVYYNLGKLKEALKDISNSIEINNKDWIGLNIQGLIYSGLNNKLKAKEIFEYAIELNPSYFPSYNNYGNCLLDLGNIKLALKNFQKSHEINNHFEEAINNIANIFTIQGKYEEAIKYYNIALKKGNNKAKVYFNIGVAYSFLKKLDKAEEFYLKSFKINPDDDILKKNYAILYLSKQEYRKAWLYYDGRLKLNDFASKNKNIDNIRHKLWKGEKISKNDKILIIKEQGVGDEIVFSSMYPDLLNNFPNCEIETEERLLSLFKRSFGKEKKFVPFNYYSKNKNNIDKFNKVLYAGSLGRLFRNNINEFPNKNFLFAHKDKLIESKKNLIKISNKPKIGITWQSKRQIFGDDKSISLEILKPILKIKNFDFINFQYGDTTKEIENYLNLNNNNIHTINGLDLFNDFESIAAYLSNIDLFISVSNTTAHLAGALGVPTWLIKPKSHSTFFYWNVQSYSTPWYPSIKLFEYKEDWNSTIKLIEKNLKKKFKL